MDQIPIFMEKTKGSNGHISLLFKYRGTHAAEISRKNRKERGGSTAASENKGSPTRTLHDCRFEHDL